MKSGNSFYHCQNIFFQCTKSLFYSKYSVERVLCMKYKMLIQFQLSESPFDLKRPVMFVLLSCLCNEILPKQGSSVGRALYQRPGGGGGAGSNLEFGSGFVQFSNGLNTKQPKSECPTFKTLFLSGIQMIKSLELANYSNTGHFSP